MSLPVSLCVRVCVCEEGNVAFNAIPNPFLLDKICLNQQRFTFSSLHSYCHNISTCSSE